MFEQAKGYAYDYMDKVHDRKVFPTDEALAGVVNFDEPMPEAGGVRSQHGDKQGW